MNHQTWHSLLRHRTRQSRRGTSLPSRIGTRLSKEPCGTMDLRKLWVMIVIAKSNQGARTPCNPSNKQYTPIECSYKRGIAAGGDPAVLVLLRFFFIHLLTGYIYSTIIRPSLQRSNCWRPALQEESTRSRRIDTFIDGQPSWNEFYILMQAQRCKWWVLQIYAN